MEGDPDERLIVAAVTPTGDVLINAFDRHTGRVRVLIVREDGEVVVLREARPGELATDLSRDGRWLLLGGGDEALQQVHFLDLEASESEPRQLTTNGGWYAVFSVDENSIYYRAASYPGSSQILRAALDVDSGRLGAPSVVAETASVNTADWRRVGYLSPVPQGVVFTVSD